MIRKTLVAAAAIALTAGVGYAQEQPAQETQSGDYTETVEYSTDKYKVETNRFWSNWFVSAGAGVQVYFGEHDSQQSFGKRLSPALDIAVGKWFTPGIGVRFMYSGLSYKGATQNGAHSTGESLGGREKGWTSQQKFNFFNFHFDAMFNLTNLFCGYKADRFYNCSPYVGLGMAKVTDDPKKAELTGHFGIYNSFRVCDALDINLDIRGMLGNENFDGENGKNWGEGALSATIGLTYKFKQRGWERGKTVIRNIYHTDELEAMREQLRKMGEENARLREALANGEKEKAQTIVKEIASSNLIVFEIGKSDLNNQSRVNLGMMAEVIKRGDSSTVYTITGYADAGTGSKARNEQLSKERAEAVYNCLVEEFGVNESQLEIDYKGGVENMFYDDPRMSRAVITRSK